MKKLYITYDENNNVSNVLLSRDKKLVDAFVLGRGETTSNIEEIDIEKFSDRYEPDLNTILTSSKVTIRNYYGKEEDSREIKRGL